MGHLEQELIMRLEVGLGALLLVDTLVEYSDSVRISYSLIDTTKYTGG